MPTYAAQTTVSSDASRNEIERTLRRYGADQFGYMSSSDRAMVAFVYQGRQVRLTLMLPDRGDKAFTHYKTRGGSLVPRANNAADTLYEQAIKQRWRALALVVKAKLEAVETKISEFDQEFGMFIVLPGGRTVYEEIMPQVAAAIETGGPIRLQIGPSKDA